jgi:hypothetical protein
MTRSCVCASIRARESYGTPEGVPYATTEAPVQRPLVLTTVWLLAVLPAITSAQWIDYKTPGLPRTPDGKVNLKAPMPRTADGKPDLTGIWRLEPKSDPGTALEASGPQPWIVDAAKKFMHELGRDDTGVHCLPSGPRAFLGADYAKFIQTPAVTMVLYESMAYRQIFTDGRPLPTDMNPTWMGYSIGRWEGNTLVVTSSGFNDRTFLGGLGYRHSEALKVTERFTRHDLGHMTVDITLEDPKAYAKPARIVVDAELRPDTELIEYVCAENERSRPHLIGTADDDRKLQVKLDAVVLAKYAGVFKFPPFLPGDKDLLVTFGVKDGALAVEIERGPTLTAVPVSQTKFMAQGVSVDFIPGPNGAFNEVVVTIVEGELKGIRVK